MLKKLVSLPKSIYNYYLFGWEEKTKEGGQGQNSLPSLSLSLFVVNIVIVAAEFGEDTVSARAGAV